MTTAPLSRVLSSSFATQPSPKLRWVQVTEDGNHLSRTPVARRLQRPTRGKDGPPCLPPIRSCSGWGLPSRPVARPLVRSYRTFSALLWRQPSTGSGQSVSFSVALSLGSPPLGVTQHPALWSSDFPRTRPFGACARGCPVQLSNPLDDYNTGHRPCQMPKSPGRQTRSRPPFLA